MVVVLTMWKGEISWVIRSHRKKGDVTRGIRGSTVRPPNQDRLLCTVVSTSLLKKKIALPLQLWEVLLINVS